MIVWCVVLCMVGGITVFSIQLILSVNFESADIIFSILLIHNILLFIKSVVYGSKYLFSCVLKSKAEEACSI